MTFPLLLVLLAAPVVALCFTVNALMVRELRRTYPRLCAGLRWYHLL